MPSDAARQAGRVGSLAGTTDTTAVYYLPSCLVEERLRGIRGLAIDVVDTHPHVARFVDPRTAASRPIGRVAPDAAGSWTPPDPPSLEDWLLIVEGARPDQGLNNH